MPAGEPYNPNEQAQKAYPFVEPILSKSEAKRLFTLELVKAVTCGYFANPVLRRTNQEIVSYAKKMADECEKEGLL